jgi:hypothetical protein
MNRRAKHDIECIVRRIIHVIKLDLESDVEEFNARLEEFRQKLLAWAAHRLDEIRKLRKDLERLWMNHDEDKEAATIFITYCNNLYAMVMA